jgi:hypothetical protein
MLYAKTSLSLNLTIKENGDFVSLDGATVNVTVKTKSTRFEKQATVTGDGTCSITLTSDETSTAGNYYVQPVVIYNGTDEVPGTVRMFELKERL